MLLCVKAGLLIALAVLIWNLAVATTEGWGMTGLFGLSRTFYVILAALSVGLWSWHVWRAVR